MEKPTLLTYETIRNLRHNMSQQDPFFPQVDLMWQAMTDWVTYVKNCETFLEILHKEVNNSLTQAHLKQYQGQVSGKHWAWKLESLTDLDLLFAYYPTAVTLEEVLTSFCEQLIQRDDFVYVENEV